MNWPDDYIDKIHCSDCIDFMRGMPDTSIDLVVTSPPYDSLRTYHGYTLDVPAMVIELWRIMKQGGVIVWVVGDATVNGSETGTSFRQALTFMDGGFNLHDTMIWQKPSYLPNDSRQKRYVNCFEYMFIFSKDVPKICNYIMQECASAGKITAGNQRKSSGEPRYDHRNSRLVHSLKPLSNIWAISKTNDYGIHPAVFPEALAADHIKSWSNAGDLVFDPMCGSGTTCKMALKLKRHWIGVDISEEYCEIARQRIKAELAQPYML